MKTILFAFILIICLGVYACKKDISPNQENCSLTYAHDDGDFFTNNTMTLEYSSDGKISKINGDEFSYEFTFHSDSVTIQVYDHFQSNIGTFKAKLNDLGLIEWQKDSFFYLPSPHVSNYSYNNDGLLLHFTRQGSDTSTYDFKYSGNNATTATVHFSESDDSIVYSFDYLEGTQNNMLIIFPDGDDIMLSGLYGKISENLVKSVSFVYNSIDFTQGYAYQYDASGNPSTMYALFMGDTLGSARLSVELSLKSCSHLYCQLKAHAVKVFNFYRLIWRNVFSQL
jgi:hypothetical protein